LVDGNQQQRTFVRAWREISMRKVAMFGVSLAILGAACTSHPEKPEPSKSSPSQDPDSGPSVEVFGGDDSPSLQYLLKSAGRAGVRVGPVESLSKEFFAVGGHSLMLSTREAIEVFEYPTSQAAAIDASRISADGYSLDPAVGLPAVQVEWVSPPHFFRQGRTMVVYLGNSRVVLEWLRSIFRDQFAGA
jgi:hypothetical protein